MAVFRGLGATQLTEPHLARILAPRAEHKKKARKNGTPDRNGNTEIVYDDGVTRRMVWRVASLANEARIVDALRVSVASLRVVPTLYDELKKRAIAIERVGA